MSSLNVCYKNFEIDVLIYPILLLAADWNGLYILGPDHFSEVDVLSILIAGIIQTRLSSFVMTNDCSCNSEIKNKDIE